MTTTAETVQRPSVKTARMLAYGQLLALGYGVTMTRREHPEAANGVAWYAEYEVRCEEHGRVLCRRTALRALLDGREHAETEHS